MQSKCRLLIMDRILVRLFKMHGSGYETDLIEYASNYFKTFRWTYLLIKENQWNGIYLRAINTAFYMLV